MTLFFQSSGAAAR